MSEDLSDLPLLRDVCSGNLTIRIAESAAEVEAAQALRYRVFYEEMGGIPSQEMRQQKRDFDEFDQYCDHLLVLDHELPKCTGQVVGTYRLLRRSRLDNVAGFYSETEFDISAIKEEKGEILELGRSCVDPAYRDRSVIQLLFRGIAAYIAQYDVKFMFGCASFFGMDIKEYSLPISYLYHYHMAPREICPIAIPEKYLEMNLMEKECIDTREAFSALPTLIKGYLRMNGYTGCGAVFDPHFNTIDIGIVIKTDCINSKYTQRYAVSSAKNT